MVVNYISSYFLAVFTKHQSTVMGCPKISVLFKASLAATASLYDSYSTNAYPYKNIEVLEYFYLYNVNI